MFCRFVAKNILSIREEREFDMFPSGKQRSHSHHKYNFDESEVLKMAALYGANGAGKSNVIRAISTFQNVVGLGAITTEFVESKNEFALEEETQLLGIEFIYNNKYYSYAFEYCQDKIQSEELYIIRNNIAENELVFKRYQENNELIIELNEEIRKDQEAVLFFKLLQNKTLGKKELLLTKVLTLGYEDNQDINSVVEWINDCLIIIFPTSKFNSHILGFLMDEDYYYFVREYLVSANVGIKDIEFSHISIEEYFGSNESDLVEKIRKEMIAENLWIKVVEDRNGRLISVLRKDDVIEVVELLFVHESKGQKISFTLDMESDGTRRLFDLIPILFQARSKETTFFVDEMERSIHPSLIHQLLLKFSQNWKTKGQIILSTHETSLLDQDIFRRDEIWFVEKDKNGSTDLYPLSDFKEHHTKNIRNGYLSGRYGGIPFLGDLEKLNYNQDAITE